MTDEQINKLKRECEYWKHQAELGSDTTDRFAKQLEEKEQECEELKFKVHDLRQLRELDREAKERLVQQLNKLKTENEGLKDDIEGLKRNLLDKENRSARYYLITSHREWNEMYKKIDYQRNKKEQAEKKLKRIEEYCKEQNLKADYTACEVLQIVDEVENE